MNDDIRQKKSDYLLELALNEQLEHDEEMNFYKTDMEQPHQFSDNYNQQYKKILKSIKKNDRKKRLRKKHLQIAACLVVTLSVSTLTAMQVEAFRLPIIQFFSVVFDKSTRFDIQEENDFNVTTNFKMYEPHYIPSGFKVVKVDEGEKTFFIEYADIQETAKYTFYFFEDFQPKSLDTESVDVKKTKIGNNEAFVIEKNSEVRILINRDADQFYLRGSISLEEAYKIMKSIK